MAAKPSSCTWGSPGLCLDSYERSPPLPEMKRELSGRQRALRAGGHEASRQSHGDPSFRRGGGGRPGTDPWTSELREEDPGAGGRQPSSRDRHHHAQPERHWPLGQGEGSVSSLVQETAPSLSSRTNFISHPELPWCGAEGSLTSILPGALQPPGGQKIQN